MGEEYPTADDASVLAKTELEDADAPNLSSAQVQAQARAEDGATMAMAFREYFERLERERLVARTEGVGAGSAAPLDVKRRVREEIVRVRGPPGAWPEEDGEL